MPVQDHLSYPRTSVSSMDPLLDSTSKVGPTSPSNREKLSSYIGELWEKTKRWRERVDHVRGAEAVAPEELLGEVRNCLIGLEEMIGDLSTSYQPSLQAKNYTSLEALRQARDIQGNTAETIAITRKMIKQGIELTNVEVKQLSPTKQRLWNKVRRKVAAAAVKGTDAAYSVALKCIGQTILHTNNLVSDFAKDEASDESDPKHPNYKREVAYTPANVAETKRMIPNHKHGQEVGKNDPIISKPIFNCVADKHYKQSVKMDRSNLREKPILAVDDLAYFLCTEFMFVVRDAGTMRRMAQRARNEMRNYDCSHLTMKEQYQVIIAAVTFAMVPPVEEADIRQHLKSCDTEELLSKHAKFVQHGNIGKSFIFSKHLPTIK